MRGSSRVTTDVDIDAPVIQTTATPEELEALIISSISKMEDVLYAQRLGITWESFQVQECQGAWVYIEQRVAETGNVPSETDLSTIGFTVIPGADDVRRYIDELARDDQAKKARSAIWRQVKTINTDPSKAITSLIRDLSAISQGSRSHAVYFDADAPKRYEEVKRRTELAAKGLTLGIPTGFPFFDDNGGDWQKGEMCAVLGMPGSGKSTLLLHFCVVAWAAGMRVLFISPENTCDDIHLRGDPMAAHHFGVQLSNRALRTGKGVDLDQYNEYADRISDRHDWMTVDSGAKGPFTIADIQREATAFRPDVIAVDGIHLLAGEGKTWETIYEAGKVLKGMAQEHGLTVLVACQGDKATMQSPEENPELGAVAYGKAIMEDSNRVISLAKDRGGFKRRSLKVPKWRDGPEITTKVYIAFDVDAGVIKQQGNSPTETGTVNVDFD